MDVIHIDPPYAVAPLDVLALLKTTRVLFYPASEFDWRPLHRFTLPGHFDCQTILYCDWFRERESEFAARLKDIPVAMEVESETVITPEQITPASTAAPLDFLRADERERYRDRYRDFAAKKGWGRRVVLRGELGDGRKRRLNLIYLGAEGVATYLQVFNQQRIAPFMLCTVGCGAGFGYNWTDFRVYADALGRAVESNPAKASDDQRGAGRHPACADQSAATATGAASRAAGSSAWSSTQPASPSTTGHRGRGKGHAELFI